MNNLRLYIISVVLVLLHFQAIASSDTARIQRFVGWHGMSAVYSTEDTLYVPAFDNALYSDRSSAPIYSETFFLDGQPFDIQIANKHYAPLSKPELKWIKEQNIKVADTLWYNCEDIVASKKSGILLKLIPFIHTTAADGYLKLISFDIITKQHDRVKSTIARNYAGNSVLATGKWYKLGITETGLYAIGYNEMVQMGIDPQSVNPSRIGIFGRGGEMLPESNSIARYDDLPEIAIEVTGSADDKFDAGDQILFYYTGPVTWKYNVNHDFWEHTSHLYTDTISCFLSTTNGSGKRIMVKPEITSTPTVTADSYEFFTSTETDNTNLIKSGRQWFDQVFDVITQRNITYNNIPPLVDEGIVKIKSVTAARSQTSSSMIFKTGSAEWQVGHTPVSNFENSSYATAATLYKTLSAASLPLQISIRYSKPSATSIGYLDYLDINATCKLSYNGIPFTFRNSHLQSPGQIARFTVANTVQDLTIWDITDPVNAVKMVMSTQGNTATFTDSATEIKQYIAFGNTGFLKPIFLKQIENQNLHASSGADLIIITHPLFQQEATRLATFHASEGDKDVIVLTPEVIYNEFSGGTTDITAIRDFLKLLYDKAPATKAPHYVLLFGDASYDYKNHLKLNGNTLPAWQSPESFNPISSLVSDDYFGMLDDNEGTSYSDVLDAGIGRLPVSSAEQAEQMVDKIINYATNTASNTNDWRNIVTFIADDEDNEHVIHSELLADDIEANHPEINIDKIYLDSYVQETAPGGNRYPGVNKAISQRVEKGSLIINYIGHGGETGWAHEEVLRTNEIINWDNKNNLPLFVTATCEFSRYDDPGRVSAGEYVITNRIGGGIALLTTTRPTFGPPNFELNKKIFSYAFETEPNGSRLALGDIIMQAKRDKGSNENGRKFTLLGDPALKIGFPQYSIVTTRFNGHEPGALSDTIKAYMEISVEGDILDKNGNKVDDFNGTIFPTVFDKAMMFKTLGNDGGATYNFSLRKNIVYKGNAQVVNGHFNFKFIVPRDIIYNYGQGKISYYATDGTHDASGSYFDFIIGGSAETANSDNQGPEIKLFMNDDRFRDGGMTDQNPWLLAQLGDDNGINTIGSGIGHDITAVLDNNTTQPYVLNNFYQSDINTFKRGFVYFPFTLLPAGHHNIKLKAWDIFNNSSEAEINFQVWPSSDLVITNARCIPNPFADYTDIVFDHNQSVVDFRVEVEIMTITGVIIRTIEQTSPEQGSVSTPVRWNGCDNSGVKVRPGLYVFRLKLWTSEGLFAQGGGKIILSH